MRITCPNCGAQYEVAEDAIPSAGRDVQCSACGQVWFVTRTEEAAPEPEPAIEPEPDAEAEAPEHESAVDPVPRRPALSPEVAAILREEAERERARREAERAGQQITPQPELGLDDATPAPADVAEERLPAAPEPEPELVAEPVVEAAPSAETPAETPIAAPPSPEPPRGRERLPDIEEINASLRAATERAPAHVGEAAEASRNRRGFRAGFLSMLTLAILALAVYIAAPRISASVPAAAPVLERYVAGVDEWRLWLDLKVQELLPNGNATN